MDLDADDKSLLHQLKEYRGLRGYLPFASFVSHSDIIDGFVTDEEALEVLLHQSPSAGGSTQESAVHSTGGAGTQQATGSGGGGGGSQASHHQHKAAGDQGRIKVVRFLLLGELYASDNASDIGKCIHLDPDGLFLWISHHHHHPGVDHRGENGDDDVPMMHAENDEGEAGDAISIQPPKSIRSQERQQGFDTSSAGGSLMYKHDIAGGPALLVPSALLQQQTQSEAVRSATGIPSSPAATASAARESPLMASMMHPPSSIANGAPDKSSAVASLLQSLVAPSVEQAQPMSAYGAATFQQHLPHSSLFAAPGAPPDTAVLPPPPGFGQHPALPSAAAPDSPHLPDPGCARGRPSSLTALPGFQAQSLAAPSAAPSSMFQQPKQHRSSTLLQSLHLRSGEGDPRTVETANPFATYSLPDSDAALNAMAPSNGIGGGTSQAHTVNENMDVSFLDAGNSGDGASLLGSGLLSSLLSDDSPQKPSTKNPFAP